MPEVSRSARHGSEKRQRNRGVLVRCTDGERAALEYQAELAGLTIGALVRARCIGTAGERAMRRPPVERAALAQALALLGRMASNVNQIARVANTTGELPPETGQALESVHQAAMQIKQLLGRGTP